MSRNKVFRTAVASAIAAVFASASANVLAATWNGLVEVSSDTSIPATLDKSYDAQNFPTPGEYGVSLLNFFPGSGTKELDNVNWKLTLSNSGSSLTTDANAAGVFIGGGV